MRIRTIKPEFFTHERLYDAEVETGLPLRLAFIGLWCAADREGRFKWEPRRLGVQILPYDECQFPRVLDALTTRGFVVRYESGSGEFGAIPSFHRHQVINNRERDSELPEPPEIKAPHACATRESRDDHASKAEGKGREHGREGKESNPLTPQGGNAEAILDEFWEAYPQKGRERARSRANVKKAWNKVKPSERPPQAILMRSLADWKKSEHWAEGYVCGAHLFIRDRMWEDAPKPARKLGQGFSPSKRKSAPEPESEFDSGAEAVEWLKQQEDVA